MEIKIVSIVLADTKIIGKYNNNNNNGLDWTYGKIITPEEYKRITKLSNKSQWRHLLPNVNEEIIVTLPLKYIKTLIEATKVALFTSKRPHSLKEELDEIEKVLPTLEKKYFLRLEDYSPKDSVMNIGPYIQKSQIIDGLITSKRCLKIYEEQLRDKKDIILYFCPWNEDWPNQYEFRVFCYQYKVTAISQYHWCKNEDLQKHNDKLKLWTKSIVNFCEDVAKNMHQETDGNWTIDVMYNPKDNKVMLVELNPFGAELSSGSALFHWQRDRDQLYGKTGFVEFRYVV